jgi:hypothetical protein
MSRTPPVADASTPLEARVDPLRSFVTGAFAASDRESLEPIC